VTRAIFLLATLFTTMLSGCGLTPVTVDTRFPSSETFLYSEFGRLVVYELEDDGLGRCPELVDATANAMFGEPTLDSDWQPICNFQNGDVTFDDVPPGPHAYVILSRDERNVVILAGCSVAEAYESAPAVRVDLYPTDNYGAEVAAVGEPSCSNADTRCSGGCR
jgi:hypothetical protein